jgi:hypothetical protein
VNPPPTRPMPEIPVQPGQIIIDDLIGRRVALNQHQRITLGRAADFPVGEDDEFMHRRFLQFWADGTTWMVTNHGGRLTAGIHPRADTSFSEMRAGPGASLPLPLGESAVVFGTSDRTYELHLTVARTLRPPEVGVPPVWAGTPPSDSSCPTPSRPCCYRRSPGRW